MSGTDEAIRQVLAVLAMSEDMSFGDFIQLKR